MAQGQRWERQRRIPSPSRSSLALSGKQRMRSRTQHSVSHIPPGWAGRRAGCRRGNDPGAHPELLSLPFAASSLEEIFQRGADAGISGILLLDLPEQREIRNSPGEITPCPFLNLQRNPLDLGFYHRAHKSAAVSQQLIGRKLITDSEVCLGKYRINFRSVWGRS